MTKTFDSIPVRQDITVLPADNPKDLRLGWVIYQNVGWAREGDEVCNIDYGEVYSCKEWNDLDWEIYYMAVDRHNPKHKRIPTNRNKIEKLIKRFKENTNNYLFAEMHFFIHDIGKWDRWEYERKKLHENLFLDWIRNSGIDEWFGDYSSLLCIFPQHEIKNNIDCKISIMENAINLLNEKDPNGYLGCYLNLVINKNCKINCYDAIKEEINTIGDQTYRWFAVYNKIPTIKERNLLYQGIDIEYNRLKENERREKKKQLPQKWDKHLHGKIFINDYAISKINI